MWEQYSHLGRRGIVAEGFKLLDELCGRVSPLFCSSTRRILHFFEPRLNVTSLLRSSTSKCGGWYAISLYYSSSIHSSVSVSSKSVAASPTSSASIPSSSGWSSGTCLTDDSSRLLTGICEYFQHAESMCPTSN